MSTHGGGCARGRRRRFSCRQLVAALSAIAPFLSQLRAHGTVCRSLWHLRRHYWRSGGSWRQRCSTAPTSDSSLTAICFCFLLDIVTCPCSLFTKRHVKSFCYNNNNNNSNGITSELKSNNDEFKDDFTHLNLKNKCWIWRYPSWYYEIFYITHGSICG